MMNLINKYSNIAKEYTERFIEHIICNQDKFPEYNLNYSDIYC